MKAKRKRLFLILITFILFFIFFILKFYDSVLKTVVKQKELIAIVKDILTILTIIGGSILTYYKFFKGRTFSAKADIEIETTLIESPNNAFLHSIKFSLVNKGNTTIWQPIAKIGIRKFIGKTESQYEISEGIIEKSFFDTDIIPKSYMVDPGEKIFFVNYYEFDKSIWAVSYDIEVVAKNGDIWKNTTTLSNT